ncbi:MAG: mechanosensitive ion channel family protein [Candidatus Bathyarchaeota archaeon]|nr:mechanosensitive ion channel family protein [Candidatus Bathyarchaeota archaeon]
MIDLAATLAKLIEEYLNLGQQTSEIIASIAIFMLAIALGWTIYFVFRRYFTGWAKGTKTKIDDEILRNVRGPIIILAILAGAYYGLGSLSALQPYSEPLAAIFWIAQILVVTFVLTRITNVLTSWFAERAKRENRLSDHILYLLRKIIQAIIFLFAFLAILVAFKIDLSSIVLGLGVGGIAIGLALQSILSDAFGAFSIYFDRPFEVGDFINVDNYSGTVRKIGLKSTRLQLLQGEELIISNKQLTSSSVRNFKKLKKRRVTFTLGLTCDTPTEKLRKIPEIIRGIIENRELVQFDRAHFTKIGDFSLNFEIVYYMKTADYVKYMDTQQEINLAILEVFEKEGIKMAFPSQTIFLNKENFQ